jgi:dihydroorotase
VLEGFLSGFGRAFYGAEDEKKERIVLKRGEEVVVESFKGDGVEVVPFRRGKGVWSVVWK